MGRVIRSHAEGDEITPLVKELTQEAIDLFEGSAGNTGPSQFTDAHAAKEVLGTEGTVASGRMSLTFAIEMLRRHFGPQIPEAGKTRRYHHVHRHRDRNYQRG